jgi:hypothetical protein
LARLAFVVCTCVLASVAHTDEDKQRPRDAAEAVKEGDVSQWLKYYERERAASPLPSQPAQATPGPPAQEKAAEPKQDPATR